MLESLQNNSQSTRKHLRRHEIPEKTDRHVVVSPTLAALQDDPGSCIQEYSIQRACPHHSMEHRRQGSSMQTISETSVPPRCHTPSMVGLSDAEQLANIGETSHLATKASSSQQDHEQEQATATNPHPALTDTQERSNVRLMDALTTTVAPHFPTEKTQQPSMQFIDRDLSRLLKVMSLSLPRPCSCV
ncbi:hypothetical protein NEOLEDRAFT_626763 [Neolentinus lepideus HHB14362 ss-1]|uniref:Uncharacterized protein n=1 Tax=Neolentinus lepideus HHB14362 ss-1 TaxID=1314782 RepID=A0A165QQ91_9AGAM|nr:hypothetical protein NEOLEDRAFT_626763 [Neolentinus lepideus HHB14362 ss-1]